LLKCRQIICEPNYEKFSLCEQNFEKLPGNLSLNKAKIPDVEIEKPILLDALESQE